MKIRYPIELDDLVALHQFFIDTSSLVRKRRIATTSTFAVIFVVLGLLRWRTENSVFPLFYFGIFAIVFTTWYWHASRKVKTKRVAKLYAQEKNKGTLCEHELEIVPDGIIERTAVGEQKTAFAGIDRIESTRTHSFVFIGTLLAHVVPHAKVLEGDVDSFMKALRHKWGAQQPPAPVLRKAAPSGAGEA